MRYEDAKLLLEFAKLMLRIATAKAEQKLVANPDELTEETVQKSAGYQKLRFFFTHLSPQKRPAMRRYLRNQVDGINKLLAEAKRTGEPFTLADIVIDMRDAESGEAFPDKPNVEQAADAAEPSNENQQEQPT